MTIKVVVDGDVNVCAHNGSQVNLTLDAGWHCVQDLAQAAFDELPAHFQPGFLSEAFATMGITEQVTFINELQEQYSELFANEV